MAWGKRQLHASDTRTDEELITAHGNGDPQAFTILIERHLTYLWSLAYRTTGNPDDAADALQDALLSAHRTAHRFRADAKVISWLHRIVLNSCFDRIRRTKAQKAISLPGWDVPELMDVTDHTAAVDLSVSIGRALDVLTADQRAAIVAVDIEGYSVADAAKLLGVAEGTIKSRCARGRLRLAKALGHLREN
ncbi:RNA polymerase sigma factor SigM [Gordonia sp. ABSL49_1]|uniref:RNA polymerase sigma factor SigM n=1 Tax=Gordonia sp. ABSL49_1 TaxID=2920941 RepID=UPI001F0F1C0F|nr:RNA polymerase sigma factor SigM [Gordonia sp. ABSL49_1]MCH5641346.1 RNA polymerase sigma factor SigM [Gordonia sp. ABSL49_1]